MPLYNCFECNYSTKLKGDYSRHLKSRKHIKNTNSNNIDEDKIDIHVKTMKMSQNEPKMSQNEPKMSTKKTLLFSPPIKKKEFKCEYCNKEFASKPNLRRHQIHRCKKLSQKPIEQESERLK